MKAELERSIENAGSGGGWNLAREYLQARILLSLQRSGAMVQLAFHGGTALRFLHGIDRFSEDLDFALERPEGYDFRRLLERLRLDLGREGYGVELRVRDQKTVHSAFVRFPGLPHGLGLSPHADQVLAIKLEVDTRPPASAGLETTVVRRHAVLNLQHHDRASLLAGKLHAVLQRSYTKGRDLYDLVWYLSERSWPEPNLDMLTHALEQTGWTGKAPRAATWRDLVARRLESLDWDKAARDVAPFLESPHSLDLVRLETALKLLHAASDRSTGVDEGPG